jgi:5-methylcytosine-specific restriction endonuclease McrA
MSTPQYNALVLNADFTPLSLFPLSVWDAEHTMKKVLKDRVIVVAHHDALWRSPQLEYRLPSVVALKRYVKVSQRIRFNRINIYLRDDFTCQYCGVKFPSNELTFDHVIPRVDGGETTFENIVASCVPCNSKKGSSRLMQPLRKPKKPTLRELPNIAGTTTIQHHSWTDFLYWNDELEK